MVADIFQILTFISGKGGSGKSATCLSMAYILAKMGFRVIVIDFDFGTHGASYFFKKILSRRPGLIEALNSKTVSSAELALPVADNFWFVSSKADLDIMSSVTDPFKYHETEAHFKTIFHALLDYAKKEIGVQFVLLDCQAGATPTVEFAVAHSDKTLIVMEPDNISADAANALRFQIRQKLPRFEGLLLTKVNVEEVESYKRLSATLEGLNYFPPLPFDQKVRAAHGRREIPVDLEKPSTFLFALMKTMQAVMPEIHTELKAFEEKKIDVLLSKYKSHLYDATERRELLQREIETLTKMINREATTSSLASFGIGFIATSIGVITGVFATVGINIPVSVIVSIAFLLVGVGAAIYAFRTRNVKRRVADLRAAQDRKEKELHDAQDEIQRFESYIYSSSREFLLDLGIWEK